MDLKQSPVAGAALDAFLALPPSDGRKQLLKEVDLEFAVGKS